MKSFKLPFSKSKNNGQDNKVSKPTKPPPDLGFKTLRRKNISGVEVDSPTRTPPRSHPESRKSLKTRISEWLEDDSDPIKSAFYITGPACIGKTAILQTVAETCQEKGWLGAGVFLSRANRHDDNSRIIATISLQLAQKIPTFMKVIGDTLDENPRLFERNLSWQFLKLITEPSKVLRSRISFKKQTPVVIVLDGLDQCMDTNSQIELLQFIDDYIRKKNQRSPLKWIIGGRPVARWMFMISKPGIEHVDLSIFDPESSGDVYQHIIRPGFRDIRRQYPTSFEGDEVTGEKWPTDTQLEKVAEAASGSYMAASCMLQFIADPGPSDPKAQLQRCLDFIHDPSRPRENNPLSPLYLVYQEILSDISPDLLQKVTHILQLLTGQTSKHKFYMQHIASSLNMELSALHQTLECLQCVLKISPPESQQPTIEFYHTSFLDFLRHQVDPSRTKSISHTQAVSSSRSSGNDSDLTLAILLPATLMEVEFDSPSRYPPPRCHTDTRMLLRYKTSLWFTDPSRQQHILLVTGPLGAGKTAFAQTLAEFCHQTSRLGASLFIPHFQKGTEIDYAPRIIPTLACQLAAQFPDYKALIAASLIRDPSVLEKDLKSQFQEFITKPLEELQEKQLLYSSRSPLVIIIDGLDASGSKDSQTELTRLIAEFVKRSPAASGLLWVICSRPEPHVQKTIWRMTVQSICRHEQLLVDDIESQEDVGRMIQDGFFEIRKRYFFRFGPTEIWPTDFHWQIMKHSYSGFFKFASCMLEYVGDEDQRDPRALLEVCLELANSRLVPHTLHPFRSLDALYKQVMLSIPRDKLPIALRALSLCVHAPGDGLFVHDILAVLNIESPTLNDALENLHSVINITSTGNHEEKIGFYHHSFPDFLKDPRRSGEFAREINMESTGTTEESPPKASSSKNTGKGRDKRPVTQPTASSSKIAEWEFQVASSSRA